MNKVFNINLGGVVFTIDEVAFEKLHSYISRLKQHFANTQGAGEIIFDIESRMAELIREKLTAPAEIVSEAMVDEVIRVMGNANEMGEEEKEPVTFEQPQGSYTKARKLNRNLNDKVLGGVCSGVAEYLEIDATLVRLLFLVSFFIFGTGGLLYIVLWAVMKPADPLDQSVQPTRGRKKLFRNTEDKVVGGVCSGVANYLGLDPVWLRIIFAISLFVFGVGFWLYIVLWIVVPKAVTAAQKLQMKGDPVDVSNIEREVKSTFSSAGKQMAGPRGYVSRTGDAIVEVLSAVFRVFGKLIAAVLFFIGVVGLVTLGVVYFSLGSSLWWDAVDMAITDPAIHTAFKYGILLVVGAPLLGFIVTGIRLLFQLKFRRGPMYGLLLILSLTGGALLLYAALTYYRTVEAKASFSQNIPVPQADTLYLHANSEAWNQAGNKKWSVDIDDDDENESYRLCEIQMSDDGLFQSAQTFVIKKSMYDSSYIELRRSSRGSTNAEAATRSEGIRYDITGTGGHLYFDRALFVSKAEGWKFPGVRMIMRVPVGTVLVIDKEVLQMMNRNSRHDYHGKFFVMRDGGLRGLDKEEYDEDDDQDNDKYRNEDVKIDVKMEEDDSTGNHIRIHTRRKGKHSQVDEHVGPVHIKIEDNEK